MKVLIALLLPVIIFITGCNTYLGKEKVYKEESVRLVEKDSELKGTYWQYNIADGKMTLTNSQVVAVSYDKFVDRPYYYKEKYIKYPLLRVSLTGEVLKESETVTIVANFLVNPMIYLVLSIDMTRWGLRWIQYPFASFTDWNLVPNQEGVSEGPGFWYRLAYTPFIANCNPFMLPPYLCNSKYVSEHVEYENSPDETVTEKSLRIEEKEIGIDESRSRSLYIDGKEIPIRSMPGGKIEIDLRDKKLFPDLLPPRDFRLTVKDGNEKVIDFTLNTTDIIDGESLYLWNVVQNGNTHYNSRFTALNRLHALNMLNDSAFAEVQKNILAGN